MFGFRSVAGKLFYTLVLVTRETPVSEPSVSSRNSESVGVGRAQTTASGANDELAIIREVRRGFAGQRLEDQYNQFEDDPFASLATSASVTELVRCGRVAWCEVAPMRSGSTADAETSCQYHKTARCSNRADRI